MFGCCVLQDAFKLAVWGSLEGPPSQKKAAAGTKRKAAEVDVSASFRPSAALCTA
jgi:hypothetical protein